MMSLGYFVMGIYKCTHTQPNTVKATIFYQDQFYKLVKNSDDYDDNDNEYMYSFETPF